MSLFVLHAMRRLYQHVCLYCSKLSMPCHPGRDGVKLDIGEYQFFTICMINYYAWYCCVHENLTIRKPLNCRAVQCTVYTSTFGLDEWPRVTFFGEKYQENTFVELHTLLQLVFAVAELSLCSRTRIMRNFGLEDDHSKHCSVWDGMMANCRHDGHCSNVCMMA